MKTYCQPSCSPLTLNQSARSDYPIKILKLFSSYSFFWLSWKWAVFDATSRKRFGLRFLLVASLVLSPRAPAINQPLRKSPTKSLKPV